MKIFGIGMSRTGTTSLTQALEILGYSTVHCPYEIISTESGSVQFHDASILKKQDAFTDYTVALFFRELDQAYPGSRFILTERDLESWLASCEKHLARKGEDPMRFAIRRALYGSSRFDRDSFIKAYKRHHDAVRQYFVNRPNDLCIMNIIDGDAWDILCPFLNQPIPPRRFPRANPSSKNHPTVRLLRRFGDAWRFLRAKF